MADSDRTYTEVEHVAIVADAITRENASLVSEKAELETKVSDLTAKIDVLEAEKATLSSELEAEKKAHADFRTDVERAKEIAALKTERAAAVKDANTALPDTYFTDERVLAWAELDETAFASVVDGIKATASAPAAARESAAFKGGTEGGNTNTERVSTAAFLNVGREI